MADKPLYRCGGGNAQDNKTVTPSATQLIVKPDNNFQSLKQVTVKPISSYYSQSNPRYRIPRLTVCGGKRGGAGISITGSLEVLFTIQLMPGDTYLYINNYATNTPNPSVAGVVESTFLDVKVSGAVNDTVPIKTSKSIKLPTISSPTNITISGAGGSGWDQRDGIYYTMDAEFRVY